MRFTIRDLLWLTVVAGLGAGWWINRAELMSRYDRVVAGLYEWKSDALHAQQDAAVWEARCDVMTRRLRERGWTIEWDPEKLKSGEDFMRPPMSGD